KFSSTIVRELALKILERELRAAKYEARKCKVLSMDISEKIRDEVKRLAYDRYKIIAFVTIGSVHGQGLLVSSRCLWFPLTDGSATAVFTNASLFAVATIFGIYLE
ncbi:predicted protein, partial [Nematostella vectensis]